MKNIILNVIPNLKATEGDWGLEIEAEGNDLPHALPRDYWNITMDPSLKAGMMAYEYVTPRPGDKNYIRTALDKLKEAYNINATQVFETQTSGVHVHMNVQQYTIKQLYTFFTAYLILEELLLTYCGPNREGNHFCLRAKDAEFLIAELTTAAVKHNLKNLNKEQLRYSSMNVFSLFKYGSIEFRAMRGTPDLEAIYTWLDILSKIKENAKRFESPYDLIIHMSMNGEAQFLDFMLEEHASWFKKKNKNFSTMIREGARLIQGMAFSVNWNNFKEISNNPFKKVQ